MFGINERAMRCFKCGGFWIDSTTVNLLSSQKLTAWRRISIDPVWLRGGKGTCPLDGNILTRYIGDIIPNNITAMRCVRCGKWWFPGESLFEFKPALEAKVNYLRMWGNIGDISKIGLPVIAAIMLIGGVITGVNLVKTKTRVTVPAREELSRVMVGYVRDGVGILNFEASGVKVEKVRYKLNWNLGASRVNDENSWDEANVICEGIYCQAQLVGLTYGREYVLSILDKEYFFDAK